MSDGDAGAILFSLFLTGLAGSLHCVAMCGPLLLGFSRALGNGGDGRRGFGFLYYHAGRLWTYALLGLLVGWAGSELHHGAASLGWQRSLSIAFAGLVIVAAAAALGGIPGLRLDLRSPTSCVGGAGRWPWLTALLRDSSPVSRLLLGAVMGFLPCGLVYAALVVAATLPGPLHGALGMLAFGAGTLPALSALVMGSRVWTPRLAARGNAAALVLLATGLFMLVRAFLPHMGH